MRHLVFAMTVLGVMLLNGCSDDNKNPSPYVPGTFKYDGKTYNLGNAITEYYGKVDSAYCHQIFLLSDSLQIETLPNNRYTLKGNGYVIKIELFTPTRDINKRHILGNPDIINLSLMRIDQSKGDDNPIPEFNSGTVRIETSSSGFLVEIDAQNPQQKTLEATYSGSSVYLDYETLKQNR